MRTIRDNELFEFHEGMFFEENGRPTFGGVLKKFRRDVWDSKGYDDKGYDIIVIPSEGLVNGKLDDIIHIEYKALSEDYDFPKNMKVIIESGYESIGGHAFEGSELREVSLPESVRLLKRAFGGAGLPEEYAYFLDRDGRGGTTGKLVSYGGKSKSPKIPSYVKSIGTWAFSGSPVEHFKANDECKVMENEALAMANYLKTVDLNKVEEIVEGSFDINEDVITLINNGSKLQEIIIRRHLKEIKNGPLVTEDWRNSKAVITFELLPGEDKDGTVFRGVDWAEWGWKNINTFAEVPEDHAIFSFREIYPGTVDITGFNREYIHQELGGVYPDIIHIPRYLKVEEGGYIVEKEVHGVDGFRFSGLREVYFHIDPYEFPSVGVKQIYQAAFSGSGYLRKVEFINDFANDEHNSPEYLDILSQHKVTIHKEAFYHCDIESIDNLVRGVLSNPFSEVKPKAFNNNRIKDHPMVLDNWRKQSNKLVSYGGSMYNLPPYENHNITTDKFVNSLTGDPIKEIMPGALEHEFGFSNIHIPPGVMVHEGSFEDVDVTSLHVYSSLFSKSLYGLDAENLFIYDSVYTIATDALEGIKTKKGTVYARELTLGDRADSWPQLRGHQFDTDIWKFITFADHYEKPSQKDKLFVYDMFDRECEEPLAILKNFSDLKVSEKLNSDYSLSFKYYGPDHENHLQVDNYLTFKGDIFKIKSVSRGKTGGEFTIDVKADHVYFEMLDDYVEKSWAAKRATPWEIIQYIQKYTDFNLIIHRDLHGTKEYPEMRFRVDRGNPIDVINKVIDMWGVRLQRHRRDVHFLPAKFSIPVLNKEDVYFLYTGKNISSLSKSIDANSQITRIYPKGGYNLTIEGLSIRDIPYEIVEERPNGEVVVSLGDGFANGIIYTKRGLISEPYIDTMDAHKYPYPKKAEVTDTSLRDKDDVLAFGIRELNKVTGIQESLSISIHDVKGVNVDDDNISVGSRVIIQDSDILQEEENNQIEARVIEHEYYPLEPHKEAKIVIGRPGPKLETIIASLMETQKALESNFQGVPEDYEPATRMLMSAPFTGDDEVDPRSLPYTNINILEIEEGVLKGFTPEFATTVRDDKVIKDLILPPKFVTIDEGAFAGYEFVNVIIPEGTLLIKESAFEETKIDNLYLPDSLEAIHDDAFRNSGIKEIHFENKLRYVGRGALKGNNITHWYHTGDTMYNSYALADNKILSLVIDDEVKEIPVGLYKNNEIDKLNKNNTLPKGIEIINSEAFENNFIEKVNTNGNLRYIGDNAFKDNSVEEVNIDNVDYVGRSAFENNFIEVLFKPEGVGELAERAFANNDLSRVDLPEGAKIHECTFDDNEIMIININKGIDGVISIEDQMIKHLVIPDGARVGKFTGNVIEKITFGKDVNLEDAEFADNNIKELDLRNVDVKVIKSGMFVNNEIEELFIPKEIEEVRDYAFANNNITKISLESTDTKLYPKSFENNPGGIMYVNFPRFDNGDNKLTIPEGAWRVRPYFEAPESLKR